MVTSHLVLHGERHEGIKDLPYRVVFGRHPPVGIFPRAEKHCVDEEDLPISLTCDNPHIATLRTEPSTDTAAKNSLLSPSIRMMEIMLNDA